MLFDDTKNITNNFYKKINIFTNLPFEFQRKFVLFDFGTT